MMHTVVIPFRGLAGAKSRLAGAFDAAQRGAMAKAMFEHVLGVACAVAGPSRTLVVTSACDGEAMAQAAGACVLIEHEGALNAALDRARTHLLGLCASRATIVAADLPLLGEADLAAMMQAGGDRIAIASDRHGTGTNALGLPLAIDFAFRFGVDSLASHLREAERLGLAGVSVDRPGLAADFDTPADLALLPEAHWLRALNLQRSAA